jgi:T5orf172 domain
VSRQYDILLADIEKATYVGSQGKALTLLKAQEGFKNRGLTLLEERYVSCFAPMMYRCDAEHEGKMTWNSVQQGRGCAKCAVNKAKLTIEEVQKGFLARGLTLLETKYVNARTFMQYRCDAGHKGEMRWKGILQGKGCAQCAAKSKLTEAQEGFLKKGLTLLEKEYINTITPMRYSCKAGHKGRMTWESVKQGYGCAKCGGKVKLTIEEVREGFLNRGLILLETVYSSNRIPMQYRCNAGHERKISWDSVQQGKGCAQCSEHGFDPSKPAMLYYVRISPQNHVPVYKVGITSSNVKRRFKDITNSYNLIQTWNYKTGQDAYDREQELLTKYSAQRIPAEIGRKLVKAGHTELFYSDILGLDLNSNQLSRRSPTKVNIELQQLVLW